jgi:hypothetical protein
MPQRDSKKDEGMVLGSIDVGKNASNVVVRATASSHCRPTGLGMANRSAVT